MSIDPVAAATAQRIAADKKGSASGSASALRFEELLSRGGAAGQGQPVSAATAAEALRLKMLGSALSLGDDGDKSNSQRSFGVQGLLDRFLAQAPQTAGAAAAGSGAPEPADAEAGNAAAGDAAAWNAAAGNAAATAGAPAAGAGASGEHLPLEALIDKASRRYGVDSGLIKAVIKAESNFNPRAVSSAGAQGLMQLMPATARGLGVTDSFDPEQNVMAGTRFLKDMLRRYGGNVDEALAAYNWGPGNVDRHGSERLPRETRTYLGKVKEYYSQYVG